jgi:response regulator RpfG family c-di-GMP phosphodiesterase
MATYVPNTRVLYVDDEGALLSAFTSLMRKEGVKIHTLQDSTQIETVLSEKGPFAVVLSDQRMPGKDGVEVLQAVAKTSPSTVRILVTGYADLVDTMRAINVGGISSYVPKPWKDDEMRALLRDAVARFNLAEENKFLMGQLEESNNALQELLEGTVGGTVKLLGDIIETVNPDAAAHASRIRQLGRVFLDMYLDIIGEERWAILRALDLCYLGIAVLPPWIQVSLSKQGLAAMDRFPVAKNHHILAASLLKDIPRFEMVAKILRYSGKDYTGYGEPLDEHVNGEKLPFGSRLLHILVDLDRRLADKQRGRDVLQRMLEHPEKYDRSIVSRMLSGPEKKTTGEREEDVTPDMLVAGMIVLEDVLTESRQCLLRAGAQLTGTSLSILRQWHFADPLPAKIRVRIPG